MDVVQISQSLGYKVYSIFLAKVSHVCVVYSCSEYIRPCTSKSLSLCFDDIKDSSMYEKTEQIF